MHIYVISALESLCSRVLIPCQGILSMFNIKVMSFTASHYVAEDESWFVWHQEHRNAWIEKKQTKPTVARAKITKRKPMLVVAITCKPKRYSLTLLPPGHTVNSNFTIQLLKDTKRRFSQVWRNPIALKDTPVSTYAVEPRRF